MTPKNPFRRTWPALLTATALAAASLSAAAQANLDKLNQFKVATTELNIQVVPQTGSLSHRRHRDRPDQTHSCCATPTPQQEAPAVSTQQAIERGQGRLPMTSVVVPNGPRPK